MNKELVALCLDTVRGVQTQFSKKDANEAIRKEFVEIFGTDRPTYKDFRHSEKKAMAFEVIEEVLDTLLAEGFAANPFFNQFVEERDLTLGDVNEFYVEDKSMLCVSEVAGGTWSLRRQKLDIGSSFQIKTSWYGAKVYSDFLRLLAGRIDFGMLVDRIQVSVKEKIATDIYTQFMGAMQFLPTEFKSTGSFVEDTALDIIQHVSAANGQAPVIIAGTKKALRKITGAYTGTNSFLVSDNMADQISKTGILAEWNGYVLLEIPQVHKAGTFEFGVNDNKLLFLPANTKPIKFVREGESLIKETMDGQGHMDTSVEYTFLTKYGVGSVFSNMVGAWDLV